MKVGPHVCHELGVGRVILEGMGDLAKVLVLVVGVVPDPEVDLIGVAMDVTAGSVHDRLLDFVGVDLEDPSLLLIDPDNSVLHEGLSLNEVWPSATVLAEHLRLSAIRRPRSHTGYVEGEREYFARGWSVRAGPAGPLVVILAAPAASRGSRV